MYSYCIYVIAFFVSVYSGGVDDRFPELPACAVENHPRSTARLGVR